MRSRLFLKIYVTLIAALAVVAITSAVFVRMGQRDEDRGWLSRRDSFLAALLPTDADPQSLQIILDRLGGAFSADITVFDPAGRIVARTGRPLPPDFLDRHHPRWGGDPMQFVVPLDDGRIVAGRMARQFGPQDVRRNALLYLVLIAAVTGVAAYPVVRHLTRRLERLRIGVNAWGGGALSTRVPVDGRDEVAAVASTFNQAADRVERLIESHRSLLANASHELRSPLARLRMAIDLLERSPTETARAEVIRNLTELDELVEEVLLASRLDHVEKLERPESVDLLALAAEEGAHFGIEASGEAAEVSGVPRLLTRLIRNLMQNALRHGAPPVSVEVRRAAGGRVELIVRDHGPGIAPAEVARIFEPFYRPVGSSETAGGWGLGLALVQQIARHHGATIDVSTPSGGGAQFVVAFPAAKPHTPNA